MDFRPTLRVQPSSSDLTLQPSPDAYGLARAYRERGSAVKEPEVVREEAKVCIREAGGDPRCWQLVLSESELQFGQYWGQTFRWLLSHDVGYAAAVVASHQKEREGGDASQSPLAVHKDALASYVQLFPEVVAAVQWTRRREGSLSVRDVDQELVAFGAHATETYRSLYESDSSESRSYVQWVRTTSVQPGSKRHNLQVYVLGRDREADGARVGAVDPELTDSQLAAAVKEVDSQLSSSSSSSSSDAPPAPALPPPQPGPATAAVDEAPSPLASSSQSSLKPDPTPIKKEEEEEDDEGDVRGPDGHGGDNQRTLLQWHKAAMTSTVPAALPQVKAAETGYLLPDDASGLAVAPEMHKLLSDPQQLPPPRLYLVQPPPPPPQLYRVQPPLPPPLLPSLPPPPPPGRGRRGKRSGAGRRNKVLCSDRHGKCSPSSTADTVPSLRPGSEKRHISVSVTISAPTQSFQCPTAEAPQSLSSSLGTRSTSACTPTRCTIYRRKLRAEKDRELLAQGRGQQSQPGAPCDVCGESRHIDSGHAFYKGQYFCSVEDGPDMRSPQEWLMEQWTTDGPAPVPRTTAWRKRKKAEGEGEGEENPQQKKKLKLRICHRCGQPSAKEYGHSQFNAKDKKHYYCALYEGTAVDLWLAQRRQEDSQQQEEQEEDSQQ